MRDNTFPTDAATMSFLRDIRFVRGYLAVGLALVLAYRWFDGAYAYWAIAWYGSAGAIAGALRLRGRDRTPWLFIAGGVTLFTAGGIASDWLYLIAYPLVAVGLVRLSRQMAQGGLATTIDALIVALALSATLWRFLFATVTDGAHDPLGTRLTVGSYPVWAIVFCVLAVRIALMRSLHTRRTMLLVAAVFLYFVGDVFWFQSVNTSVLGDWMDYAWLGAYVCFGAAALHPSPVRPAEDASYSTLRRFHLLAVPVALVPAAMLAETLTGWRFTFVDGLLLSGLLLLLLGRLGSVLRGLNAVQAELREQNRLKDELISVVSHDLRTPLTSIMGYLELALAPDTEADESRQFLEVVQRNTGRLHRLVEDLLFVSRVQSGKDALNLEVVDVGEIAEATVAAALPAADRAEVELVCDVSCHDRALGDEHRIAEVLENLLSNALKFTPPGGRVSVWVGRVGEALVIRVSDTGIGITEDDRRYLFDRFFRAPGTDGVPGAGLGLSIVKAIVDAHGGRVSVQSRVGSGTTFEVRFPLLAADAPDAAAAAA